MRLTNTQRIMEAIEGATIVCARLDVDDDGLSIHLADGRVLIFAGVFAMSLMRLETERLH